MKPEILKVGKTPVELGTPLNAISIDLTERCNLRCTYCFCDYSINEKNTKTTNIGTDLTFELGKEIVDWFLSKEVSGSEKMLQIDFWGGEPLLKFDLMKEITAYVREQEKTSDKRVKLGFTTNIILMDEEKINWFSDNKVNYLLSCDGIGDSNAARKMVNGNNSWDVISEKLTLIKKTYSEKKLIDTEIFPAIRLTVNKFNLNKFGEDLISFFEMGFKGSFFSENFDEEWNEEDFIIFEKQLMLIIEYRLKQAKENKKFFPTKFLDDALRYHRSLVNESTRSCGSGHGFMAISTEGAIYPCHRLNKHNTQQLDWHDKYLNLGSIWENITNEELYNDINKIVPVYVDKDSLLAGTDCEACKYFNICNGGCFAVKFDNTEKLNGIVPNLCKTKEIIWNISLKEFSSLNQDPEIEAVYGSLFRKEGTCTCDSTQYINEVNNIKELLISNNLKIEDKDDLEMLNMLYLLHNHLENNILELYSLDKLEELLNIYNLFNNILQGKKDA